ncbi:hypothetical protein CAPTEDRAFT_161891 [Capitella teleta]|uniref:Vacuolar protein-sorting-associated protein 25 n=1 Tax=Capitella teleta TaxID=283909 RepID=R7TFS1_CAPTE|nr:hypothetical protein CAPTEDRAFT_161891 [Capitella teleta]|eukprot:ELT92317.1 hypothetical protein CAPTEDRAFT_161891 [Capitella teleta]
MGNFEFPWQYNFPPFFTLQPNADTRRKQLDAWRSLVLDYHRHNKQYTLDIAEAQSSDLFFNKSINRKLSLESINTVLEELRKTENLEWKDKSKKQCMIMWRSPAEWAKLIYQWVTNNGMNNTVCTIYELQNGDDTKDEDFHGLDSWLLDKALKLLVSQHKAETISYDGSDGVKFF